MLSRAGALVALPFAAAALLAGSPGAFLERLAWAPVALVLIAASALLGAWWAGRGPAQGFTKLEDVAPALQALLQELATANERQALSAGHGVEALAQMQAETQDVDSVAERTTGSAQQLVASGELAEQGVDSAIALVAEISAAIQQLNTQMAAIDTSGLHLRGRASAIHEIASRVGTLAERSHMLALNAAMESARAGAHGRGFAVVSREMRSLADGSHKSAVQVKAIISEIQGALGRALGGAQESNRRISGAETLVARAVSSMEGLATLTRDLAATGRQIAQSAEGQRAAAANMGEVILRASESGMEQLQFHARVDDANGSLKAASQALLDTVAGRAAPAGAKPAEALALPWRWLPAAGALATGALFGLGGAPLRAASCALACGAAAVLARTLRARALTRFLEELRRRVLEVEEATGRLASSSAEHGAASSAAMEAIEQSRGLAQTLTDEAGSVAEAAKALSARRARAEQEAAATIGVISQARAAMAQVREQMVVTGQAVRFFSERAAAVGEIAGTVAGLSRRSNLLALNAAIEASRAGEEGRGFAVVAQEMGALASHTSQAASEVKGVIAEIQEAVRQAVSDAQQGEAGAAASEARSEATTTDIQRFISLLLDFTRVIGEIDQAASDERQTMARMMDAISTAYEQESGQQRTSTQVRAAAERMRELSRRLSAELQSQRTR